jgi:hypothetical protein
MRIGICPWCGNEAPLVRHHPTGDVNGHHFDRRFTVGICVPCHAIEHQAWRRVGIADITDPVLARITRLAWFTGHMADLGSSICPADLRGMNAALLATLELLEGDR